VTGSDSRPAADAAMLLSSSTALKEKAAVQMNLFNDELQGLRLPSESQQCRALRKTAQSIVMNTITKNLAVENMD
jgi:hypothetical protein